MRNILDMPRTKQSAFFLLDHIIILLEKSGKAKTRFPDGRVSEWHQRFDSIPETLPTLQKAIRAVSVKWVRKEKTSRVKLQTLRRMKRVVRRVQYKNDIQVFNTPTVPTLRHALPKMHGQGTLRKSVAVHPYRPMDTFLTMHRVNVYRQGSRFDVIDALCNIPILAGITRQALKKVVSW